MSRAAPKRLTGLRVAQLPTFQPWASAIGSLAGNTMDNLPTFAGSGPGTSPPSRGSLRDSQRDRRTDGTWRLW